MNLGETNGEYLAQNEFGRNKWRVSRSKRIRAKQTENISLKLNISEINTKVERKSSIYKKPKK
jgi:hypothetical protein